MDGYFPMKMKRKDLDDVNDEFSDFSLSSPARKIRRLDADLPPIMEEEEPEIPLVFGQSVPPKENFVGQVGGGSIVSDELTRMPENVERAIVLFKTMNTPLLRSRSPFSISVNSDLLSGFKNPVLWSSQSNLLKASDDDTEKQDEELRPSNGCLAVVPWVPNHSQHPPSPEVEVQPADVSEMMEAEETEAAMMDIEDNTQQSAGNEFEGMGVSEGLNHWQQYCMIPQPPQNSSTPITWFNRQMG